MEEVVAYLKEQAVYDASGKEMIPLEKVYTALHMLTNSQLEQTLSRINSSLDTLSGEFVILANDLNK